MNPKKPLAHYAEFIGINGSLLGCLALAMLGTAAFAQRLEFLLAAYLLTGFCAFLNMGLFVLSWKPERWHLRPIYGAFLLVFASISWASLIEARQVSEIKEQSMAKAGSQKEASRL